MNKIRKMNWRFSKLEYKLMEEFLEEMSDKGWMIVEINNMKASFVKGEPRKLKFFVDITPHAETFSHKGDESLLEEYRNSYKDMGWQFITSYDQIQIFYSEELGNNNVKNKLELDKTLVIDNVWKSDLYKKIYLLIYLVVLTGIAFWARDKITYNILLDGYSLFTIFVICPLMYIYTIVSIIKDIVWYVKAKKNIKNGLEIRSKSFKWVKVRNVLLDIAYYIFIVFFVSVYFNLSLPRGILYNWTTKLLFISIAVFVVYSLRFYIKFSDYIIKKRKNGYIFLVFVFMTLIIYLISEISLNKIDNNPNDLQFVPEKYSVIKISDFADIEELEGNDFTSTYSPLVPIHYKYDEYYYEETEKSFYVNTEYFKCINENISNRIYDDIVDRYNNSKYLLNSIKSISAEKWGCDKATLISENWILLLHDNQVLEISVSKDLINIDSDEFRERLFDKFELGQGENDLPVGLEN